MIARSQLLAYAAPGLPLALLGLPLYVYVPTLYAEFSAIPVAMIGVLLLGVRLLDVVSDPAVGYLSDHWQWRGDRRVVPMILGVPALLIGAHMLFDPAADADGWYLVMAATLTYLGWTMISIPWLAWGAELSAERFQRTRVTTYREAFVIGGTVAALLLVAFSADSSDYRQALQMIFFMLAATIPIAVVVCARVVSRPPRGQPMIWSELRQLLKTDRALRVLLLGFLLNGLANGFPATLFLLFTAHVLQAAEVSGALLGIYFICGLCGLPIWLLASRRFGKRNVWTAAMLIACAAFAFVPFLSAGSTLAFAVICVLTGLTLGADLALPASMQADVIGEAETEGGNRAGLYFGLWGMTTKLSLALAVGIAFPILDAGGFEAGQANSDSALTTLTLLYGIAPVLIKLIAIAVMSRYPESLEPRGVQRVLA